MENKRKIIRLYLINEKIKGRKIKNLFLKLINYFYLLLKTHFTYLIILYKD